MPKIVSLGRERESRERDERDSIGAWLRHEARDIASGKIDGFAIIAFRHDSEDLMFTTTRWRVRKLADKFTLSDLARAKIAKAVAVTSDDDMPDSA